jgi:hypothetical protein
MGRFGRLIDWIDSKIDRPADQSVLRGDRNPGSETILEADDPAQAEAAAANVRHRRDRRRWRWLNLGK